MEDEVYAHIRNKIIDYLSRQTFSEKKLLSKVLELKRRYPRTKRYEQYTASNVQRVIDDLKGEGIIDDRRYAQDVLRQLRDTTNGIRRISEKMRRRLIPQGIIREVLEDFESQGRPQDYAKIQRETFRKYSELARKHPGLPPDHPKIRTALFAFLARKGYMPDDIGEILKRCFQKEFLEPEE